MPIANNIKIDKNTDLSIEYVSSKRGTIIGIHKGNDSNVAYLDIRQMKRLQELLSNAIHQYHRDKDTLKGQLNIFED